MANLYFYPSNSFSGEWGDLNNWWSDSGFTVQASALPTSNDNVFIHRGVYDNENITRIVNTFTCQANVNTFVNVTANSFIFNAGEVSGVVNGDVTFYNYAYNGGTINGNCQFYNNSNNATTINGYATFHDSSRNEGTVSNATFNDSSLNMWYVTFDAIFNDYSINSLEVSRHATFNDYSYNQGAIIGDATFSLTSAHTMIIGGFIGTYGNVKFKYEKGINGSSILGIL